MPPRLDESAPPSARAASPRREPADTAASAAGRLAGEDPAFLACLAEVASIETDRRLAEIRTNLAAGELEEASHAAHSLRGVILNFGPCAAADTASALESCCREGRADEARRLLARLEPEGEHFLRRMEVLRGARLPE